MDVDWERRCCSSWGMMLWLYPCEVMRSFISLVDMIGLKIWWFDLKVLLCVFRLFVVKIKRWLHARLS